MRAARALLVLCCVTAARGEFQIKCRRPLQATEITCSGGERLRAPVEGEQRCRQSKLTPKSVYIVGCGLPVDENGEAASLASVLAAWSQELGDHYPWVSLRRVPGGELCAAHLAGLPELQTMTLSGTEQQPLPLAVDALQETAVSSFNLEHVALPPQLMPLKWSRSVRMVNCSVPTAPGSLSWLRGRRSPSFIDIADTPLPDLCDAPSEDDIGMELEKVYKTLLVLSNVGLTRLCLGAWSSVQVLVLNNNNITEIEFRNLALDLTFPMLVNVTDVPVRAWRFTEADYRKIDETRRPKCVSSPVNIMAKKASVSALACDCQYGWLALALRQGYVVFIEPAYIDIAFSTDRVVIEPLCADGRAVRSLPEPDAACARADRHD